MEQVDIRVLGELFCPVWQRVQINYIFSDNVCIELCLSWNVNKLKTTTKLSEKKAETSVALVVFDDVLCTVRSYRISYLQFHRTVLKELLPFLPFSKEEFGMYLVIFLT